MVWLGWLVALAVAGGAFWLWRQVQAERARAHELLYIKMDLENSLDALHQQQVAAQASQESLRAATEQFDAPIDAVRARLHDAEAQIDDYRRKVRAFDAAVQYCLQPVELIYGADKASLEQLVKHVEGARRKLFDARAALEKNPLHRGTGALDGGRDAVEGLAAYARALREPGEGERATESLAPPAEPTTTGSLRFD